MASKAKSSDVKVLKGQEAEDAILQYLKRMNRPFGAVDVAANLKGAVPKATTQKILIVLAEKGEIVQKTYGKTSFFVANQANIDSVPADKLTELEAECKTIEESTNVLAAEVKSITAELSKLKNCPTDEELDAQIASTKEGMVQLTERLVPLRSGTPLISPEELVKIDADWATWRAEWIRRRKVFMTFWQLATDSLPPQDAEMLIEDLGMEFDTTEHKALEKGPLCTIQGTNARINLKRKRE
ncbi:Tat binding protein 1-interacting protein-domain-containing protein [Suillus clintonianus]|uniref:Tat binding protein 1-interacting protein-domain-containing protein n=1 Tax=Suillus clintonianus TaxID=1904413 RepID=UPI001B8814E7|nr:Tat binding protein 1-interacting protein-domain-containing protein [Suillus clintonianus]KAG2125493.1 Tat binding protein 1-interacting protein-domain-containing protein [Suillus clintonianus]